MTKHINKRPEAKADELSTDAADDFHRIRRAKKTKNEMQQQGEAIRRTLKLENDNLKKIAKEISHIDKIYMLGCGDSWILNLGIRFAVESITNLPCIPVQALDYSLYHSLPTDKNSLVIGISSSGKTEAVINSLDTAKNKDAFVIGVSNTEDAKILKKHDGGILVHATREGWPTQSSTATMAVLIQFFIELSKELNFNVDKAEELEEKLLQIAGLIDRVYNLTLDKMENIADELVRASYIMLSGAGSNYAPAGFGAAKIKELSPINAEAFPLEEFHHYRTLKDSDPFFLIAPDGPSKERAIDTVKVGKYDGGKIFALVSEKDDIICKYVDAAVKIPEVDERLAPIIYSVPLHQFAYYLTMKKHENGLGYPGSYISE